MELCEWQEAVLSYDAIGAWGHCTDIDGVVVQLIGATITGGRLTVYGISNPSAISRGNRQSFLDTDVLYLAGEVYHTAEGSGGTIYPGRREQLLLTEFLRQGLVLSSPLASVPLRDLMWMELTFHEPCTALPDGASAEITVTMRPWYRREQLAQIIHTPLPVRADEPIKVLTNRGERTLYLFKANIVDIWAVMAAQFDDPAYQARFTREELAQKKQFMQEALADLCPPEMRLIELQYEWPEEESSLDLRLIHTPSVKRADSTMTVTYTSAPEQERGSHGGKLRAAILAEPVYEDIASLDIEITHCTYKMPSQDRRFVRADKEGAAALADPNSWPQQLQAEIPDFDELQVWGHYFREGERCIQLAGLVRSQQTVRLYGLAYMPADGEGKDQLGKQWTVSAADGEWLCQKEQSAELANCSWKEALILTEFLRQGWEPYPALLGQEAHALYWFSVAFGGAYDKLIVNARPESIRLSIDAEKDLLLSDSWQTGHLAYDDLQLIGKHADMPDQSVQLLGLLRQGEKVRLYGLSCAPSPRISRSKNVVQHVKWDLAACQTLWLGEQKIIFGQGQSRSLREDDREGAAVLMAFQRRGLEFSCQFRSRPWEELQLFVFEAAEPIAKLPVCARQGQVELSWGTGDDREQTYRLSFTP